jgi:hypothetical protein
MRLFHFSESGGIDRFEPRGPATPSARPAGREWLNGPLVWAIDDDHQPMYLFPRDCPRLLAWPLPTTTRADLDRWWAGSDRRMLAYLEWAWLARLTAGRLYRYELPADAFESLTDAGMWVARSAVEPLRVDCLDDLPGRLCARGVELRVIRAFREVEGLIGTSFHVSAIRMRNAGEGGVLPRQGP